MDAKKSLLPAERALYRELKSFCRDRLKSSLELTAALQVIREKKLYREEFGTFEAFCQAELERPASSIYRDFKRHKCLKELNVAALPHFPISALDHLRSVPAYQRQTVLQESMDASSVADGHVTYRQVKEAAKKNSARNDATYVERADRMNGESRRADLELVGSMYEKVRERVQRGTEMFLEAVNEASKMGMHLQMIRGREKMDKTFWIQQCAQLPFDLDAAKKFISVTEKLPSGASSFPEAAPCLETLLIANKVIRLQKRAEPQAPAGTSPSQQFYLKLSLLRPLFTKMTGDIPMEDWGIEELSEFVAETAWLPAEREKAMTLLGSKK